VSSHLCCERESFVEFKEYHELIAAAGDNNIQAKGIGKVKIIKSNNEYFFEDVLYVPSLKFNF